MKTSLRIAMVAACPFPYPRGTPVRILRMAEALSERGHDVHVVTYHLGSGDTSAGVTVHRIPRLRSYRKLGPGPTYQKLLLVDPFLIALLRRLLRGASFDVIHAHHYEGLLVGALARAGRKVPLVYDAHTLLESELPFYSLGLPRKVKASLGRWLDTALPRLSDHVVCVTEVIRDKLIQDAGIAPERLSVISNGVELDHFDPDTQPRLERNGVKAIIFTGNLARYQGIDLLLRAFREVVEKRNDARLVIASDSSFEPYEPLARDLGVRDAIRLVPSPKLAELPALLANADLAVNPRTECDGIPMKLLNYMASARPVVSFAASAPGVEHGRTGWLVENGDVTAFGEGILTLLGDEELAVEIGRRARRYVAANCRWPVVADRAEAVYRKVIEASR